MKTKKAKPLFIIALLGTVTLAIIAWIWDNLRAAKKTSALPTAMLDDASATTTPVTTPTEIKSHVISSVNFVENEPFVVTFPEGWKASTYVIEMTDAAGAAVLADIPPATRLSTSFTVLPTFAATNITIRVVAI